MFITPPADVPFDSLIEAIRDPVAVFRQDDHGCRVVYANPAFEAMTETALDQLQGRSLGALLAAVHPEDRHTLDESMQRGQECEVRVASTATSHAPYRMRLLPMEHLWAAILHDETPMRTLEQELVYRATRDGLTGFLNKTAWTEQAQRQFAASLRYGRPLALVMLDLDHFKRVNDEHGHATGDEVLRAVSQACQGVTRRVDVLGRLGGEELALLAPETGVAGASTLAVRICNAVRRVRIGSPNGEVSVTMSAGVAERSTSDDNLAALLARADVAMYAAKAQGRDRVVLA